MGLFTKLNNNETNLKSLKFGNDRPGGGDSGQPFIQTNIPTDADKSPLGTDFLLRGGINAPSDALEDVSRLTKYMFSSKSPSGLLFIAKQNLLSRVAPKTEASKGIAYAGGTINSGIYTPLSTLAQAGVGFLGTHLNKQGIDPTGLIPGLGINSYEKVVYENNQNNQNRLVNILDEKQDGLTSDSFVLKYGGGPGSFLGVGKTSISFATDGNGSPLRTGVNSNSYQLYTRIPLQDKFKIPLGASSIYNNYIQSFSQDKINNDLINNGLNSYQEDIVNNVYKPNSLESQTITTNIYNNYKTWNQQDIIDESRSLGESPSKIRPDFRSKLDPTNSSFISKSPDYTKFNIEDNLNLGNPGQKGDISDYTKGKVINGVSKSLDKVNASYIYKSKGSNGAEAISRYNTDNNLKDIIPFYIAVLNNDRQERFPNSDTYKKYMHFRAFIDSFSDSYDADWKSLEYMGRAEKFYKYGGFDRKISMAFTVVAQSKQEITAMYDKLNFLASSLAPEYLDSASSGYMAGNISYITLGDYIVEQPGIITSLTFDIPEESPWEIGLNLDGTTTDPKDVRRVPHMIKVTGFNFIPLHKFRVEKQSFQNDILGTDSTRLLSTGNQRYIDQLRGENSNYDQEAKENIEIPNPNNNLII